jgi:hypothetical protein
MRYRPRRFDGPITLIVCDDNARRGLATPWRTIAGGGLDVRIVPGDHETYLRETPWHAAVEIERCLDDAERRAAP